MAQRPARSPGGHPGAPARRQGRPHVHRPGKRRARPQTPQVPARRRPDHAVPGAAGTAGSPRAARARCCGSSASTSPTSRAPTWSAPWWWWRTACRRSPTTASSPSPAPPPRDDTAAMHDVLTRRFRHYLQEKTASRRRPRPSRRTRPRWTRPPPRRSRTPPRRRRGPNSPTRPTSWWSTAASRRSTRPPAPWRSWASRTCTSSGLAKRLEEVWLPDSDFPVILPRASAGPVPAAADPRRGPPLRHHLPPAKARQGHDGLRAGRRARAGRVQAQGPAGPVRLRQEHQGGHAPRNSPAPRASARPWPRAIVRHFTPATARTPPRFRPST